MAHLVVSFTHIRKPRNYCFRYKFSVVVSNPVYAHSVACETNPPTSQIKHPTRLLRLLTLLKTLLLTFRLLQLSTVHQPASFLSQIPTLCMFDAINQIITMLRQFRSVAKKMAIPRHLTTVEFYFHTPHVSVPSLLAVA